MVNPDVSRRQALRLLAQVGAAAAVVPVAAGRESLRISDTKPLGEIAASRGILFGTAFDADMLTEPKVRELYLHHARIFTADNFMKFGSLRPNEGLADFTFADKILDLATQHNIPVRGHNLIWNEWNPDWVRKLSSMRAEYWLDRHIDEVVGHYAGKLHSWDVINEPLWPQHGLAGGYRNGPWYAAMGEDYVLRAMRRARAADPKGKFVINESGPEWEDMWGPTKPFRDGMLRIVDEIQQAGIGLDAVGLQCHWFPEFRFDPDRFRDYLRELASHGVAIYLTELDVGDGSLKGSTAVRDAEVARRYEQLISAALKETKVEVIQTWELTDGASWLRSEPKQFGPHGRLPRPLPFDDHFQPKAAYHAIAKILAPAS